MKKSKSLINGFVRIYIVMGLLLGWVSSAAATEKDVIIELRNVCSDKGSILVLLQDAKQTETVGSLQMKAKRGKM